MRISVIWSLGPRSTEQVELELPDGATVEYALNVLAENTPRPPWGDGPHRDTPLNWSVWGRAVTLDTPLRADDRLAATRDLRVDPKVARRERFRKQGAKTAGLFQKRRPGAKPGY
jgi:hypothetical protein